MAKPPRRPPAPKSKYPQRDESLANLPWFHDFALDLTYEKGPQAGRVNADDLLPPRPFKPEEIATRLAVRSPQSAQFPGWIEFDAARPDGRAPWRKRDRHPGLALHNADLGGYALVLGAGEGQGYRLVLLNQYARCFPLTDADTGDLILFDTAAEAVLQMEQLFRLEDMPPGLCWAEPPGGVPPVVLVSGENPARRLPERSDEP
jgi:hypothetical protein